MLNINFSRHVVGRFIVRRAPIGRLEHQWQEPCRPRKGVGRELNIVGVADFRGPRWWLCSALEVAAAVGFVFIVAQSTTSSKYC